MPIYDFECEKCGRRFEELVRPADANAKATCPECGQQRGVRVPSLPAAPRSATAHTSLPRMRGACGRCGDPDGPCGAG